ncbi:MAG: TonB-dependent receptor [Pseudomonadota bacterium]
MNETFTRNGFRAALFVVVVGLLSPNGNAQRAEVDEIVVTATRIPIPLSRLSYAADVIEADDIQRARPLLGLDEALQGVPGLVLQNRFNFAQDLRISMRGFGARSAFGIRGIRLVVDGIPETLPDGQGGVDGIDLSSAGRIEVLRGGAASIYGNAGGGVILVETAAPQVTPRLRTRAAVGSDGYRQSQIGYSAQHGTVGVVANVADLNYTGFREHSAARNRQGNLRLTLDQGNADWLLSAHHTDQPEAFDPGGITAAQADAAPTSARTNNVLFDAGEDLSQTRVGLRYRWRDARFGELLVRGYGLKRGFAGKLPFESGGQIDIDRSFKGAGVQWQREWQRAARTLTLNAVLDTARQEDDRQRFNNLLGARGALSLDQKEQVSATGVAFVADVVFSDAWSANLGVRHDTVDYDVDDRFFADGDDSGEVRFSEWSPTAGVHWRATPNLSLYANASRSFETPSTTELANPSQAGGFNQSLDATLANHRELGARWSYGGHQLSAALYRIDIEDELIPFELAAFPGRDFFTNAGSSDRRGVEVSWSSVWFERWRSQLTYTRSDFAFDRFVSDGAVFDGNTVPGTAEHVAFASLDYEHPSRWYASAELSYVSEIELNNANTARSDSFTRVELRAGTQFSHARWRFEPFINVSNAFDTDYAANTRINAFGQRYFEPGPDRAVFVGMTITWQPF